MYTVGNQRAQVKPHFEVKRIALVGAVTFDIVEGDFDCLGADYYTPGTLLQELLLEDKQQQHK